MKDQDLIKTKMVEFLADIENKGFNQNVLWKYGKICRIFSNWAEKHHIIDVSEETLREYAMQTIGYWNYARNLPYQKRMTLMVLRRWNNFLIGMPYEYRIPAVEYHFLTKIAIWIDSYLDWRKQYKMSRPNTIDYKKRILFKFDQFLFEEKIPVSEIRIDIMEKYFSTIPISQRINTKSTIKDFYQFLYDNKLLSINLSNQILKEPKRRKPEKLPTTYTVTEIKQLLESIDRSTAIGKRDYLILLLCAQYGLRASDIVRLNLNNFDWKRNVISIHQYKTDIELELPLLASVGNAVIDYLKHGYPFPSSGTLIVSHMRTTIGQNLNRSTIHSIVTAAFKKTTIKGWKDKRHGPHSLRHSLASNLLKQEVSLMTISAALGHKSAESTKVYIKIDIENLRKCGLPTPILSNPWFSATDMEAVTQ